MRKLLPYLLATLCLPLTAWSQNVGIGTSTPASRLDILGVGSTSATSSLNVRNASTASMLFVRDDGMVGIGTTAPTNTLHLIGTARISSLASGSTQMVVADPTGVLSVQPIPSGGGLSGGVATRVAFWSSATTLSHSPSLYWDNTLSTLGIGTSTPVNDLVIGRTTGPIIQTIGHLGGFNVIESGRLVFDEYADYGVAGDFCGFQWHHDGDNIAGNKLHLSGYCTTLIANIATFTRTGYMGLGTQSPAYQLELTLNSAAKPTSNTWTIPSDRRTKEDIQAFTDGLDVLTRIEPKYFRYNGLAGTPAGEYGIGIVAQEIQQVAPYTVSTFHKPLHPGDATETELLGFDSHALTFVTINAVKELNDKVEQLQQQVQQVSDFGQVQMTGSTATVTYGDAFRALAEGTPVVTLSASQAATLTIVDKTASGFKIVATGPVPANLTVDWIAMAHATPTVPVAKADRTELLTKMATKPAKTTITAADGAVHEVQTR